MPPGDGEQVGIGDEAVGDDTGGVQLVLADHQLDVVGEEPVARDRAHAQERDNASAGVTAVGIAERLAETRTKPLSVTGVVAQARARLVRNHFWAGTWWT